MTELHGRYTSTVPRAGIKIYVYIWYIIIYIIIVVINQLSSHSITLSNNSRAVDNWRLCFVKALPQRTQEMARQRVRQGNKGSTKLWDESFCNKGCSFWTRKHVCFCWWESYRTSWYIMMNLKNGSLQSSNLDCHRSCTTLMLVNVPQFLTQAPRGVVTM